MFAVQCSFCQHENVPGARFCAECGSPLHLRVCPNPKCGKVSDVNAAQCEFCGTSFPKIPLAEPGSGIATSSPAEQGQVDPVGTGKSGSAPKPSISAWPLIAVAIVAGGLPLLWFNRASLPTPRTWQTSPEVERLIAPPVLPPATAPQAIERPEASLQAPSVPPAQSSQSSETLVLPPLSAPIQQAPQTDKGQSSTAGTPATASAAARVKEGADQDKVKQEAGSKKPMRVADKTSDEPAQPSPPCTEAAAALGLCDAKHTAK